MAAQPKILALSGSSRKESLNRKVLAIAVIGAKEAAAEVTVLNLADYPLPLYDGDLEAAAGVPAKALELKKLFLAHQGLLIACPEYNSSVTPLLKNTIDWVSRPVPGEAPLGCFVGKVAALVSASPGALGGFRAMGDLRTILSNIGVMVMPNPVAVPRAHEAFDASGEFKDLKQGAKVKDVGKSLAELLNKL